MHALAFKLVVTQHIVHFDFAELDEWILLWDDGAKIVQRVQNPRFDIPSWWRRDSDHVMHCGHIDGFDFGKNLKNYERIALVLRYHNFPPLMHVSEGLRGQMKGNSAFVAVNNDRSFVWQWKSGRDMHHCLYVRGETYAIKHFFNVFENVKAV